MSDARNSPKHEKSQLTGPIRPASSSGRIEYRRLESTKQWIETITIAIIAVLVSAVYVAVLIISAINALRKGENEFVTFVAVLALGNELVKSPLVLTLAYASILAKKPIAIRQDQPLNVLLGITFVPKSEDINRLREVLIAAKRIRHTDGDLSICVFNEGTEHKPFDVFDMIEALNAQYPGHHVHHISRLGIHDYNKKKGKFAEKTKYGNINAGLDWIRLHPEEYGTFDVLMGIDPDHVPMEEFGERMLGPFNDPDVAFVVGPQAYENASSNLIARWAESNQYVFHALMQPVANTHGAAMLVGTSYAIRFSVLEQIDGIQPSITEDLATTFAILSKRNPNTRTLWKSVYTPDVLAHGEGPGSWGGFFQQQSRWARGALEFIGRGPFFKQMFGMWRKPWRVVHYAMLMAFYPIMSLSWLLAAANSAMIAVAGANGRILDPEIWIIFYGWATMAQIWLYFRMRRHNVSPFETRNSWGFYGMFMGVVTAPVYADALVKTIFRRPVKFDVTPKGVKTQEDRWFTFRLNIRWAIFYAVMIVVGYFNNHLNAATLMWACLAIALLAAPIILWKLSPSSVEDEVEAEDENEVVLPSSQSTIVTTEP